MTHLVLDDLNPKMFVSANRRIHHMQRSKVCGYWRELGHQLITDEYGHADQGEAWHQRIHMTIWFRFPNLIRRDALNFYPYVVKPLVDGMVDGRLLPDDNDRHLIGPDFRRNSDRGPHQLLIDITDTSPAVPTTPTAGETTPTTKGALF